MSEPNRPQKKDIPAYPKRPSRDVPTEPRPEPDTRATGAGKEIPPILTSAR